MEKDEERILRYKELSEEFQALYASPKAGASMFVIFKLLDLPDSLYKTYAEMVGDTILGFHKITDLPRLFQQKLNLSADDSQRMTSRLIDLLSPVVRREEEEAQKKKEELNKLAQTFTKPAAASQPAPQGEYSDSVEPIRTMEQDMSRVHGYGAYREQQEQEEERAVSSQDDLLKKD